jgi:Cft2 family RNA processing exonuclease
LNNRSSKLLNATGDSNSQQIDIKTQTKHRSNDNNLQAFTIVHTSNMTIGFNVTTICKYISQLKSNKININTQNAACIHGAMNLQQLIQHPANRKDEQNIHIKPVTNLDSYEFNLQTFYKPFCPALD